jgi:hypothetical protein
MQSTSSQVQEPKEDARAHKPRVHVVTYIKLRSFGKVCWFMRQNMHIYETARGLEGFVAGGIRSMFWRKEFWTFTTWDDRDKMMAFVQSWPHSEAAARHGEVAEVGQYVEWESDGLPDWDEALERLQRPTGQLG